MNQSENNNINPTADDNLLELLSDPNFKGLHNHKKLGAIVSEMQITPMQRLFLWLSKTDYYVLSLSTYQTKRTLESLGMMVLFTSLLAFMSSFYAIKSSLITGDSILHWLISILIASVYAFGIMIIDREIVGAVSSFKSTIIRAVFALFIALAVSYPVKLAFYDGRIKNEISDMINERNADKINKIDTLEEQARSEDRERKQAVLDRIAILDDQIDIYTEEINKERTRNGDRDRCGPICKGLQVEQQKLIDQKSEAEKELGPFVIPEKIQIAINALKQEVEAERDTDFLTKREALNRIAEKAGLDFHILSWFLLAFFIMLETVPLMLKLSIGKTEYHYYLESRQQLNNQKIISLTNLFMEKIQKNPKVLLDPNFPVEIGDIIMRHIEDEMLSNQDQMNESNDEYNLDNNQSFNSAGKSSRGSRNVADTEPHE